MRFLSSGVIILLLVYDVLEVSGLPHRSIRSLDDGCNDGDFCTRHIEKQTSPSQTQHNNDQNCTTLIQKFLQAITNLCKANCNQGYPRVQVIIEKIPEKRDGKEENQENAVQTIIIKSVDDIPPMTCSYNENNKAELGSTIPYTEEPELITSIPSHNQILVPGSSETNEPEACADKPEVTSSIPNQGDAILLAESSQINESEPELTSFIPSQHEQNSSSSEFPGQRDEILVPTSSETNEPEACTDEPEVSSSIPGQGDAILLAESSQINESEPELASYIPSQHEQNSGSSEFPLQGDQKILVTESPKANESEPCTDEPEVTSSIPNQGDQILVSESHQIDELEQNTHEPEITYEGEGIQKLVHDVNESEPDLSLIIPSQDGQISDASGFPVSAAYHGDQSLVSALPEKNEREQQLTSIVNQKKQSRDTLEFPDHKDEILVPESHETNESEPCTDEPELTSSIPSQNGQSSGSSQFPVTDSSHEEKIILVPESHETNESEPCTDDPELISTIPSQNEQNSGSSEFPSQGEKIIVVTESPQTHVAEPYPDEQELTMPIPSQNGQNSGSSEIPLQKHQINLVTESPETNESEPCTDEQELTTPIPSENGQNSESSLLPSQGEKIILVTESPETHESEPCTDEEELTTPIPSQNGQNSGSSEFPNQGEKIIESPQTHVSEPYTDEQELTIPIASQNGQNSGSSEIPLQKDQINLVTESPETQESEPCTDEPELTTPIPSENGQNSGSSEIPLQKDQIILVTESPDTHESEPCTDEQELTTLIPSHQDQILVSESTSINDSEPRTDEPELSTAASEDNQNGGTGSDLQNSLGSTEQNPNFSNQKTMSGIPMSSASGVLSNSLTRLKESTDPSEDTMVASNGNPPYMQFTSPDNSEATPETSEDTVPSDTCQGECATESTCQGECAIESTCQGECAAESVTISSVEVNPAATDFKKEDTSPTSKEPTHSNPEDTISYLKSLIDNPKDNSVFRCNCTLLNFLCPQGGSCSGESNSAPFYYIIFPKRNLKN